MLYKRSLLISSLLVFAVSGGLVFSQITKQNILQQKTLPDSIPSISRQRFILMGDVGTATLQQLYVGNAIKTNCFTFHDCQGVFILGDIIYEEGIVSATDPQLRSKLEEPYKDIDLPFYLVLGNHDYLGCVECYLEYAKTSTKWYFPSHYYNQDFEVVSFFVIDTENFDQAQQQWLKNQLATSTKTWKIVLGHRPIISEEQSKKYENWQGKKELKDIVCNSADFYISGHAHLLEDRGRLSGCNVHFLISGAGGSNTREMAQPFTGAFYAEENGFLSLAITHNTLQYTFIDKKGNMLYEQSVEK